MWLNPHEVASRLLLTLVMIGVGVSILTPDTQLTAQQLQEVGKERSKDRANERLERKRKNIQRKKDDNAKHSIGYCKRCGIYD